MKENVEVEQLISTILGVASFLSYTLVIYC